MSFFQPSEVLFADEFSRPLFNMGPYDNAAMARNLELARATGPVPDIDWSQYFGAGAYFTPTLNGREAISLAIADLGLAATDEILIKTTSCSRYVSSCITQIISRYCRWSRRLSKCTRAIFVVHEFGFPARLSRDLRATGLPIIEDCAYALGSQDQQGTVGRIGDYVIYSFSKAFPMPYGGLLKSRRPAIYASALSAAAQDQLPRLVAYYLSNLATACRLRCEFYDEYRDRFAAEGFRPLFEPGPRVVPHSFIVAMPDQKTAEAMKPQLCSAGINSSVFYGGGGYFLPNHQSLSKAAIDYIVAHFVTAFNRAARLQ